MKPIRRRTSILDLSHRELAYLAAQAVGFAALAYVALSAIGFAPEALDLFAPFRVAEVRADSELPRAGLAAHDATSSGESDEPATRTLPTRIQIPEIGVDTTVSQPSTVNVDTLDALLAEGAVYYPGSGTLEGGNLFVFGHSTNWPVVRNQAYKTFNGLDKLSQGDAIYVTGAGRQYLYRVTSVRIAPDSEVLVRFDQGSHRLTLSTCNTFGLKEDRIVVEADYAGPAAAIDYPN